MEEVGKEEQEQQELRQVSESRQGTERQIA